MHDIHMDRLEIFFWIQWCAFRGHPRSSYGSKKVILGSKIWNMVKCTWYAYRSIANFLLNSLMCIPRSSKGSNKVILGSKVRNIAKYTWNAYESIQNFILILMAWKSSSFTVIERVKRVILGLKHLNHDKINKMIMSNDRYWIRYWIHS